MERTRMKKCFEMNIYEANSTPLFIVSGNQTPSPLLGDVPCDCFLFDFRSMHCDTNKSALRFPKMDV